jgi:hypothetical protein
VPRVDSDSEGRAGRGRHHDQRPVEALEADRNLRFKLPKELLILNGLQLQ